MEQLSVALSFFLLIRGKEAAKVSGQPALLPLSISCNHSSCNDSGSNCDNNRKSSVESECASPSPLLLPKF